MTPMIKFKAFFTFIVLGMFLISSCTIQKRKHLSGWHVSSKKMNKSRGNDAQASNYDGDEHKEVKHYPISQKTTKSQNTVSEAENEVLETAIVPEEQPSSLVSESNIDSEIPLKLMERNEKTTLPLEMEADLDQEKVPWVPRMWGGILGVLLALTAMVPVFLIVFFFLDGDYDDTFEIYESSDDSPFRRAFKRSYNTILRIGIITLTIALGVLLMVALIAFLYSLYGLFGVLVGLLIIFLLFLLLLELFERIFEFILPGGN